MSPGGRNILEGKKGEIFHLILSSISEIAATQLPPTANEGPHFTHDTALVQQSNYMITLP